MKRFRQFFEEFEKGATLSNQLTWSHVVEILPIEQNNERNYYINQCIINNLSVRELRQEIKNKSFDRLAYADKENIKLVDADNYNLTIEDMIKDPIIIETKDIDKLDEKTLHKYIIEMLENRFLELGVGFTLAGHEYKIKVEGHTYSIDLLFFNYKLNAFVVIELKIGISTPADIDQTRRYANFVDKYVKEKSNNNTIGLLISKGKDGFKIEYATEHKVYLIDYELKKKTSDIILNKMDNKLTDEIKCRDITNEFSKNKLPPGRIGNADYIIINGKKYTNINNKVIIKNDEEEISKFIYEAYGGNVEYLFDIVEDDGVRCGDIFFKDEVWGIKRVGVNAISKTRAIDNLLKNYERQANNFILDITDCTIDKNILIRQVMKVFLRNWIDKIIIVSNNEILNVFESKIFDKSKKVDIHK